MVTTKNNKSVQCNLVLEKQIECADLRLLQKRSSNTVQRAQVNKTTKVTVT